MTKAQIEDLETIHFFIPQEMKDIEITEKDKTDFLDYSERGINKELVNDRKMNGFNALIQGKRWRGIHMQMWEDGVLDGSIPYDVLIHEKDKEDNELPHSVVHFMAKEMFKGKDKELIESIIE